MGRERWVVHNPTQRQITIGDLPRAPTITPNNNKDLLEFHTHSEITQSTDLATLLNMGWLRMVKTNIPSNLQLNRIEEDELREAVSNVSTSTSSSFTITDDKTDVVLADASAGDMTVTLPKQSPGRVIHVKKIDATSNVVTVDAVKSQTIDGELTQEISLQYTSIHMVADGSNWHII
jgi:hypothetical protein